MRPDILVVVEGVGVGGAVESIISRHLKYGYNVCKIGEFHKQKWSQSATESLF